MVTLFKEKPIEAVWEQLRNDDIPRHSAPEVIITDQGSEFKGEDFAQWLRGMGIEHRRTTPKVMAELKDLMGL